MQTLLWKRQTGRPTRVASAFPYMSTCGSGATVWGWGGHNSGRTQLTPPFEISPTGNPKHTLDIPAGVFRGSPPSSCNICRRHRCSQDGWEHRQRPGKPTASLTLPLKPTSRGAVEDVPHFLFFFPLVLTVGDFFAAAR